MSKEFPEPSPFDDPPPSEKKSSLEHSAHATGPGQFSLAAIMLVMFDVAFVFAWWTNAASHSYFGEEMGQFSERVIGSTLRLGVIFFPCWTFVFAFLPSLIGAALGSCALPDYSRRRRLRGASMFWTLMSAIVIETSVRLFLLSLSSNGDGKLLWFAFGNLGWSGLVLVIYMAYMAMVAAGYGLVISLILSLLGRWKMIPVSAPWKDAPWKAMWILGLYGPYVWLVGFLIWELAGMPELLSV